MRQIVKDAALGVAVIAGLWVTIHIVFILEIYTLIWLAEQLQWK